ncbi:MAG: PKD domain-containing protein [Chitinophagaceae bacterium]
MKRKIVSSLFITAFLLMSRLAFAQLQANFTMDKTGGCSPVAINFTNTSTGTSSSTTYKWDFGNGNTSVGANAGAVYNEEKSYTVTLTIEDGGKSSVKTQTVTVYGKPTITDIAVSVVKGCLPVNANFTANANTSSGYISSYVWDFGDGNTQQGYSSSQQHTYTVPQKATISLTVANNYGCTNTLQKKELVEILPSIKAAFTASQTILCRETDAVQFSNSSDGPGTLSYVWDFGDGTSSTNASPSHSFNTKGIYTVKLTTTSSEGCVISNTQAGYINVASFKSDFSVPPLLCKNSYYTFNSTSTPYTSNSNWEVDGAPYYYYYGNYINYTAGTPGNHTIKLKNVFGTCPDSITKTIVVNDIPYPNEFIDTILGKCGAPVKVDFKDTTAGAVQWEWNFMSNYNYNKIDAITQAASYTYSGDGGYTASLKVTNAAGCSATTSKYIGITSPHASISASGATGICGPVKLKFTANSSDQINIYNWNFGDGTTSPDAQPEHLFSNPGTYSVTLTFTTSYGCVETASYGQVRVYGAVKADFTVSSTNVCGNTPVYFNATANGTDLYYYWDFGDGQTGYSGSTSHQYSYDSTYTVKLIVSNGGNCRDTLTKTDYIKVLPPFPQINTVNTTCDGTRGLVTFTQASRKAESYVWNFGDGTPTVSFTTHPANVTHNYTQTGNYTATLTVTNAQCSLSANALVRVLLKQKPQLSTTVSEICSGASFAYQINNIEANPMQNTYQNSYYYIKWQYDNGANFNGGFSSDYLNYWYTNTSGTAVSYSNEPANIRVIFRSTFFGCDDTTNYVAIKFKGAYPGFAVLADKQCWKTPVTFQDTSKANGSSKIVRWDWNFGDGSYQSFSTGGNTVTHQYNTPASYNVTLSVTDASGCSSPVVSKYVEVYGPKAGFYFSPNPSTITLPVYFYNNTNNYNSYSTQYKWDFGDGATSTDYSPVHTYNTPGTYIVKLIALNAATCNDTITQSILVQNFKPAFTYTSNIVSGKCPPVLARFTNNSINYTSVKWDFGDGITADNLNYPSHVYEKPGKYIVTLYIYGVSGLQATYKDSVIIKQPSATLNADTLEICINGTVNLNAVANNVSSYLWDFGDGSLSSSTSNTTAHSYTTAGIYNPSLMVVDNGGCAALTPLGNKINVHANPIINFSPAAPVVCKGSQLQITASGGTEYAWVPGTGLSDAFVANPYASPSVNTTYTVNVKDNIGCSASAKLDVIVSQPVQLKTSPDTSVCFGKNVPLLITGADSYQWINNTIGLSSTNIATPFASPLLTSTYTVTGADKYHCFSDTANIKVTVMPLPIVNAGADVEVLGGTQVQLNATGDNDIVKWNWSPTKYLNCINCASPISTPLAQMDYVVTATNRNGCIATDTVIVKLICDQDRVRIPNAFTPNNDGSNDLFMIKGISLVKHLIIFDRWGQKMFERSNFIAADKSSGWDGNYNGNPATAGTYIYFVEMQCASGDAFTMKGSVVLIR